MMQKEVVDARADEPLAGDRDVDECDVGRRSFVDDDFQRCVGYEGGVGALSSVTS